MLIKKTNWK